MLDDLRVLAVTEGVAGGYCSKLLADAGADVVLVEPDGGSPLRHWSASGRRPKGEDGALFRYLHASQRSVVGDWRELVDRADMVVTDVRGLVPEVVPGRVVVTITPFGTEGPWADLPATEFTLQAWSGSTASRGTRDRPPVAAGGRIGLWVGGTCAAMAGLAAMRTARATGRGEHVDVSILEAMCVTMVPFPTLFASFVGGRTAPGPPRSIEIPSVEPTADGWVGFTTISAQQFQDFLLLIERPDLIDDADLAMAFSRNQRVKEFLPIIAEWTTKRTTEEVIEQATLLRIPVTPIGNGALVPTLEHFRERGVFVESPGGGFVQPRIPYRLDGRPPTDLRPPPSAGADSGAVAWTRRAAAAEGGAPQLPLEGVRIVDFTAFWAGPAATQAMAALGAEVVKVESVQRPDGMRFTTVRPPSVDQWWEWCPVFHGANSGKRSITLDLNREEGKALVERLVADADAVVENFTPRVLETFGLDWPVVHELNPGAVMVRMPAFGLDGPWRDRTGFAQTVEMVSGMAWVTGYPDDPPRLPRGACDPVAGMHACIALMVGLDRRERDGAGMLVEIPLVESALNIAAEQVVEHSAYGVLLERQGNGGPGTRFQDVLACEGDDAWVAVSVVDDAQEAALAPLVGDDGVVAWCASRTSADAARALLDAGVPAAEVVRPERVVDNPQLQARRFFEELDHPVVGRHRYPSFPFVFRSLGEERHWLRSPPPTLGQHNDEVLGPLTGDLDRLRAEGVVGERPAGL